MQFIVHPFIPCMVSLLVVAWYRCAHCSLFAVSSTVRAEIFAVVLFSRISRVKPSRKFPLQFMSIYSNDNISQIAKLTTRELPHLAKTAKITVREYNGVYSIFFKLQILVILSKMPQNIFFLGSFCVHLYENKLTILFFKPKYYFHP